MRGNVQVLHPPPPSPHPRLHQTQPHARASAPQALTPSGADDAANMASRARAAADRAMEMSNRMFASEQP